MPKLLPRQPGPQVVDRFGGRREIVSSMVVGVQRQIGFDPFKLRHHATKRAYVLAVTGNGGARRNRTVAATGHDQLGAGSKLDWHRCAARIDELLVATGLTLRAARHVMPGDSRAKQVEADDVITQFSAKASGDGSRNLDGRERNAVSVRMRFGSEGKARRSVLAANPAAS